MTGYRIQLPSSLIGRYVRYCLGFGVAVAVGMAPFLGNYELPLFEPLLNLFPEGSKIPLIPLSAFLMGFVALVIQFYSGERIPPLTISRRFKAGSTILLVAFFGLVIIYTDRVLPVPEPRSGREVPVVLGWQRLSPNEGGCTCTRAENDLQCAYSLGMGDQLKNLEICWPSIPQVRLSLHLLYLALTGGFGTLIGLLLLQDEARRQKKSPPKPRQPAGAAAKKKTTTDAPSGGRVGPAQLQDDPSQIREGHLSTATRRFRVAFSFAGEKRSYVAKVATVLAARFGEAAILYDKFHEAELARRDLGFYLPDLYHKESDLVVVVICPDYKRKEWCGLEWDAIFDLLKQRKNEEIMLCRFDHASVKGLYSTAGFVELDDKTANQTATRILERLALNEGKPKDYYLSSSPIE